MRLFLRNYVDRLKAETSGKKIIRERVIKSKNYCGSERSAPLLAPRWTRAGYKGHLKNAVIEACDEYYSDVGEQMDEKEEEEEKKDDEKKEEEEKEEDEEVVEETVLQTSTDQQIDQDSDDDHLEIDDGF